MFLIQVMPAAEELRTPVEGDRLLLPAPEVAEVHREAPVPAEAVSAAAAALRDQLQAVSGMGPKTYSTFFLNLV